MSDPIIVSQLPIVATAEATLDVRVETFELTMTEPAEATNNAARRAALETMLRGLTARSPVEIRRDAEALTQAAGLRPHKRIHATARARRLPSGDGFPSLELRGFPAAATDDVRPGEGGLVLEDRAMRLLAAKIVSELENL